MPRLSPRLFIPTAVPDVRIIQNILDPQKLMEIQRHLLQFHTQITYGSPPKNIRQFVEERQLFHGKKTQQLMHFKHIENIPDFIKEALFSLVQKQVLAHPLLRDFSHPALEDSFHWNATLSFYNKKEQTDFQLPSDDSTFTFFFPIHETSTLELKAKSGNFISHTYLIQPGSLMILPNKLQQKWEHRLILTKPQSQENLQCHIAVLLGCTPTATKEQKTTLFSAI